MMLLMKSYLNKCLVSILVCVWGGGGGGGGGEESRSRKVGNELITVFIVVC